ncbi:TolC family protein [Variovorax sp. dw_954]|uniref:TolC family protein n=1 Tax=Variovorax sp. dw_954 TaxID=2720078 RepID=UPI001BD6DCFF|nr:TolC family protein [Variovorax sp. dw_954]
MSFPLIRSALLAVALLPCLASAAATLSLEAALQLAVQRSDAARASRAGILGATESARAAGQLPDPTLRVGIDNLPVTGPDRFSTTREPMTMKRVGISQEWLSTDKRNARQAAADATVERETVQARAAIADIRLQTTLAYVDAFYAAETSKLATAMEHHAREEFEAARARLAAAAVGSQEVLALGVARGTAEDEASDALQQQDAARLALQRWVGVMPDALAPLAEVPVPGEDAYVAGHPTVAALQRDLEVAKRAAAVAASNRSPNWTWEVGYGQRTGYSDLVTFGVSIPIPVAPDARQDRDTAARLALADKAEADLAEATRVATTQYQTLQSDARRLRERIERYRASVLATAAQRSSAAMAAYRSNQATLATLFESRHAEAEAQRKLLALQRDLARTLAQLAFRPIAFADEVAP